MSSTGSVKQQQMVTSFLGFGLLILLGPCCWYFPLAFLLAFSSCDWVRAISPRRSARVSMLDRFSRIGVWDSLGPGLDLADRLAWSLCCQQYNRSSDGSSTRKDVAFRRDEG